MLLPNVPDVSFRCPDQFPGYAVRDDGSFWSCKSGEWIQLRFLIDRKGYCMVAPRKDGRNHTKKIHRMVLELFVGPCPKGMETRHKNGDPKDNRLVNLEWATPKENASDKRLHGTHFVGSKCHAAKLNDQLVVEIREKYKTGDFTQRELAEQYGMTQVPISQLIRGVTWGHVK